MRLGVVGNRGYGELGSFLTTLQRVAPTIGVSLVYEADLHSLVPDAERMGVGVALDGLVTLGGDGTFLRGARSLDGRDLPILGVNLGRLGFLTACGGTEVERALRRFAAGDYVAERRMMLQASLTRRDGGGESWYALNDVVLHQGGKARVIRLIVDADGDRIASYAADGLILATPTGSSAYSLSSGGPLVDPRLDCIILTPISPHTLTVRPLLLSPATVVSLRVADDESEQLITVDGQQSAAFVHGDVLAVQRASRAVSMVRFSETTFFSRMRRKLGWGGGNAASASGETDAVV